MKTSKKAVVLGLLAFAAVVAVGIGAYLITHRRVSPTSSYFRQQQEGRVNADVQKTLSMMRPFLDAPANDFRLYEAFPLVAYKYSIAFTAYAYANIAAIEPARRQEAARAIDRLISKMVQATVWEDWRFSGWGKDPLDPDNIMWKGHLNLMYALHILTSGEDKYEGCFHRLSDVIATAMAKTEFGAAVCETINYYFQCNTVSMLSLRYHDAFFKTDFENKYQEKWLNWAREHMVVQLGDIKPTATPISNEPQVLSWFRHRKFATRPQEEVQKARTSSPDADEVAQSLPNTRPPDSGQPLRALRAGPPPRNEENLGLIYAVYHPLSDVMDQRLSGYTNAWAITFLNFFDPDWARSIYPAYKRTFINGFLRFAYAEEAPKAGIDGLATLFALFAASEMRDEDLFDKLLNLLSLAGRERFESVNPEFAEVGAVTVDFPKSVALQGPLLFGKTNIGVAKLFHTARPRSHGPACKVCPTDEDFAKNGVTFKQGKPLSAPEASHGTHQKL